MPPPPPPSKSYLLVLDTDSEDEEEEESYYPRMHLPPFTTDIPNRHTQPHIVEPDEEDRISEPELDASTMSDKKLSKTQKKNRSRRKKNKKKSKKSDGTCTADDAQEESESKPRVSFSNVQIQSYARCFSTDTVPGDGGWPLGMEIEPLEGAEELELEEYEAQKQERLKERWERILEEDCDDSVKEKMTKRPEGTPVVFETRQWDYLSSLKNPLFRISHEQDRQAIFLGVDPKSLDSNPPSPKRRTRSNSVNSVGSCSSSRTRSNSVSSSEQFNETYNQVMVHHCRNELEELRNLRSKSGATGCNCRKLHVYLPPKDGSGGKGAQRRRLKPSVLAKELKKRNMYNDKDSREKMEKLLHDLVEKEPCCGDDCFCARNGIDCQSDACSCWHDSHVHAKAGSEFPSVEEIQSRCGNPVGMYTVNFQEIDSYRTKVLKCAPCSVVKG